MHAFVNSEFVPLETASLHVSDLAIQRGYGVFDFFRLQEHVPLYLNDYLDRFYRSAEILGLQCSLSRAELQSVIYELIEKNNLSEAGVKLILTGGYSPDAYIPVKGNLVITQHPLVLPTVEQVERGIKVITHEYRRDLPEVKSINYIMGVWLQKKVQNQSASDVLYYRDGKISEFPRSNFFLVTKEGTLVTADKHILHGITRMKVLQLAKSICKVEERDISLADLRNAQEAFLTSTTKRILPVVQVDDFTIADGKPGSITRALAHGLAEVERKEISKHMAALNR